MINEAIIRRQKSRKVGIQRIPAYAFGGVRRYTQGYSREYYLNVHNQSASTASS